MSLPNDQELEALLRRLHLANAPRVFRGLCEKAEQEQWAYRDLLAVLFAEEVAHRQNTRLRRLSGKANFPFLRTIDEFDFTYQSTLRLNVIGSYLSPDFVTEGRCLILSGKPGRGKTHLAIAIAYRAIQNGFEALFATAAQLIDDLSSASRDGNFREALAVYVRPHVLVIDEVGYLTYGTNAANVLFHVVNDRHLKKRPMIFTTNKPLDRWGQVLHDDDLAETITDRILERGRHLKLDGVSFRTKHLAVDQPNPKEPSSQPAIISGKDRPEFPEPTEITMPNTRKRYPPEFKQQVVELARTGRSLLSLAKEFGITDGSVRNWVKQADLDKGVRSDGLTTEERQELSRLRRENRQLKMERDILSKAAAWFARETGSIPNGSSKS